MNKSKVEKIIENFIVETKQREGEYLIFSLAIPVGIFDTFNVLDGIEETEESIFFAKSMNDDLSLIGFKSIYDIKISHDEKLELTGNEIQNLQKKIFTNYKSVGINDLPIIFGGFKFNENNNSDIWNDYTDSDWFVPKCIFIEMKSKFYIILNYYRTLPVKDDILKYLNKISKVPSVISTQTSKPNINEIQTDLDNWLDIMNAAINKINNGEIKKVVLSRFKKFKINSRYKIADLMRNLSKKFSQTTIFAFKRNTSFFIGATPELFLKLKDNELFTDALAGSIKRGNSLDEDNELARELLENKKERSEHNFVVDFILTVLSKHSSNIIFDPVPEVKKLSNVQHLQTKIKALLKADDSVFDLIGELYPTPALCGLPVKDAKKNISALEKYPRGLYTGLIGWINQKAELELFIGIRSALIKNNLLFIFAGCGIVEGSEAIKEFQETEIKLKPILNLFTDEKTN